MSETIIASFILRFTREHDAEASPSGTWWRGVVRHVQTSEDTHFTRMEDALAFITRYVDIDGEGTGSGQMTSDETDSHD